MAGWFDDLPTVGTKPAAGLFDDIPTLQVGPTPAELMMQQVSEHGMPTAARDRFNATAYDSRMQGDLGSEQPDPFAGEGAAALIARRGQQFGTTLADMFARLPEAGAIAGTGLAQGAHDAPAAKMAMLADRIAVIQDTLANTPDMTESQRQWLLGNLQAMQEGQAEGLPIADLIASQPVTPADQRPMFGVGDTMRDAVAGVIGSPDPRDQSFGGKLAQAFGSIAGVAIPSLATGLVAGPGAAVAVGGGMGAAAQGAQTYDEAKAAGSTEPDALRSAGIGALIGSSEILPIGQALRFLPPAIRAKATGIVSERVAHIAASSGEEAAQEFLSQVANNLNAAANYDPTRGTFDEAGINAALGAIAGGTLGAIGTVGMKPDAAQMPPPSAPQAPKPLSDLFQGVPEAKTPDALQGTFQPPDEPTAPEPDQVPGAILSPGPAVSAAPPEPAPPEAASEPVPQPPRTAAPAMPDPPREPTAPTEPDAPPAETQTATEPRPGETVYTPEGDELQVETTVVEADSLLTSDHPDYPPDLQPRDRDRAASQTQIESIANGPRPLRLDQSPETDRGAPIVGPDGATVESGNGRVMGLRLAYQRGTAEAYRAHMLQKYPQAAGMKNPIIVRRRITDTNATDFAIASNQPAGLQMSASETARADARLIDDAVLGHYRGGGMANLSNRPMITAFIAKLPQAVQGSMITKDGGLTADGHRRFQSALFHKAYGDEKMLERLSESLDDDMRSVTQALTDEAGHFAKARLAIQQGKVSEAADVTPYLVEAVRTIADFRRRDMDLAAFRQQMDAFSEPTDPLTDQIMGLMFNPAGKRLVSKRVLNDLFSAMAQEVSAQRVDQGQMPGIERVPLKSAGTIVDEAAKNRKSDPSETPSFLERGAGGGRSGGDQGRPETQPAAPRQGRAGADQVTLQDAGGVVSTRRPKQSLTPQFMAFSFTNRTSVYGAAFRDVGIDPATAKLKDEDEQIAILAAMIERKFGVTIKLPQKQVRRKNLAGRMVSAAQNKITAREGLDQVLDAYRQMQMLAAVLGVNESAIGLPMNGKGLILSLVGRKDAGALGLFRGGPQGREIVLPGRSNSFAHEWGHAFDHFLNTTVSREEPLMHMLSRNLDLGLLDEPLSLDPEAPKVTLARSFAWVLVAMFGDKAKIEALTLQMQVQSAERTEGGMFTPRAKKASDMLERIRSGKRPPFEVMSQFFKTSAAYDAAVGMEGYFTDPAEMFARSFEAWVGTTVAQLSNQPQSFLSKGDWAYTTESGDPRMVMTYPKGIDADSFTMAMTDLSASLGLGSGVAVDKPATVPEDVDLFSNRDLLARHGKTSILQAEARELAQSLDVIRAAASPAKIGEARRSGYEAARSMKQTIINTTGAAMYAVADRQKGADAKQAFTLIANLLAKRPGRGKLQETVYQDELEGRAKNWANKIFGAVKKNLGTERLTNEHKSTLRRLLTETVDPETITTNRKLIGLATDLRGVTNEIWYQLVDAGVGVGFQKGYLPHVYDVSLVDKNPEGFEKAAGKVYRLMFTREIINEPDPEDQAADMETIIRGLERATKSLPTGEADNAEWFTHDDADLIKDWRDARREAARLQKKIDKALEDGKDATDLMEARDKALDLADERKDQILPILQDYWSRQSAEAWLIRIKTGQLADYGTMGPTTNFTKKRRLPREAGEIMAEFMPDDPVSLLTGYAFSAARNIQWTRTFGAGGEKLETMLNAAAKGDNPATSEDIDMMKLAVNAATGRMLPSSRGWTRMRTLALTIGNLKQLTFAVFWSLSEPVVASLRTGSTYDGLHNITSALVLLARKGRRQELREIAGTIGMIAPYSAETLMEHRLGADALDLGETGRWLQQQFFIKTGLTPLTQFQQITTLPVAHSIVKRMLRQSVKKRGTPNTLARDLIDGGGKGSFVNGELNELGIPEKSRADLLDWLQSLDGVPRPQDLYTSHGELHPAAVIWARAVRRLTHEIIQNPLKTDRAIMANHPDHAAMYGIMSFIDTFTRNILFRNLERGIKDDNGYVMSGVKVTANVALLAAPLMTYFAANVLTTIIRELLVNKDTWDEKKDDDELAKWIMTRAFNRMGITGRLDPLVQMYLGIKYERDLTSITAGPALASILSNVMAILKLGAQNSPNTNTGERNAAKAAYQLLIQPALAMAISAAGPGGPISANLSRLALGYVASYDTANNFATATVGPPAK